MTSAIAMLTSFKDYQGRHHPRKRLFSKINFFRDELRIVADIMQQQAWQMSYFKDLLNPNSFMVTSRTRKTLYNLERNKIENYLDDSIRDQDNYDDLQGTARRLAKQATQQIEIQQEDHGKAILVFTVVTIVFLPLTFVAGLLGMNTADIRNQTNGQWLFWAIALPLTWF
jgi:Mg2+ and Co2+ transporter CorA